ncbi:DUF3710 domain-containing protein [Ornithinimicrobium pekingense]|uniref:DUF3710 domain-containing protein n=1 Tax=Ornithinimicrobium pekingense TaxID=384677 RepID=A0ABQ2F7S9_9MICO|nr:DUF3710 domain-containing protein [Ornithinimicrobium pekingense]GGK70363.1 hypothetical protein GCM10011509_18510 [Ornithinimicrobium pekingense]
MALFGRKKREPLTEEPEDLDAVRPEPAEGEPGVDRAWDRAGDGPYDVAEWPELDGRIDLGALRLPAVPGMQMRLDLEQGSGRVVGATLGFGASQAQLQVFAAPRTLGLWDELRPDIARGLVEAGGAAEVVQGVLGKEIRARMPGRAPDGRVAFQPARFLGIDGPRWFLRVVVNGPAATDDAQLRPILTFLRGTVVRRGDEPRPPRELLELTAPEGVVEAAAKQAQARREAAQKAAAEQGARPTQVLRSADATAVSGVSPSAPTGPPADAGRHRPPEVPDAPKAPSNPEFT